MYLNLYKDIIMHQLQLHIWRFFTNSI